MRIGELTRIVTEVDLRLIVRGAGGEGVMSMRERMGPALVNLLPVVPILVPLAGHFVLVNFAMLETMVVVQGGSLWLPLTYIFYNIIFFYVGIWTLQDKQNIFPVAAFIFVVVISGLNDIIMLGANYSNASDTFNKINNSAERTWRFSSGMMILNLIAKPFTIALACVSIYFRTGAGLPGFSAAAGAYQPVQGQADH